MRTKSEVVNYEPWTVTGSELLQIFSSSDTPDWLADLDLSRLTALQITEIEKRISVIKLSAEFLVDADDDC